MTAQIAKPKKSTATTAKKTAKKEKQVVVREVKKSAKSKNMVDLRTTAPQVHGETARHYLTVKHKGASQPAPALEELPKFTLKREAPSDAAEVREFDLEEKIDFKKAKARPLNIYRKISISFILLTAILVAAMAYFSFVKVDISVILNKEQVKGNAIVDIVNEGQAATTSTALAGLVKEVSIEQTRQFEATGKQVLGSDVTGKVTITNNYVRNQPLVANTRLVTADNQMVRIKNTVSVPAGGSVEAEVFSTEATSSVNIAQGTRLTIPGLWQGIQDKIYAESLTPITYEERFKLIISESDLANVTAAMKTELENKIKADILTFYQSQYAKVLYKVDDSSLVVTHDGKVGEARDAFTAKISAKAAVVAFSDQSVKQRAQDQLKAQLPGNKLLVAFDDQALGYELGTLDIPSGTAAINVNYAGTVMAKDQSIIDKSRLIGLTSSQLENYLKSLPEIASYQVKFTPGFIGKVPYWIDRINVTVNQ